ncbi:hypothetical protein CLV84_4022 [Neolewinella xylanilytica]|uniref:Uncharacterized protein n=1 Tax=Neolewinella xylanilytica TaxID=1514080 RepID=A0A2S6I061_9BACT|nr:hypothetical protein [Neolewinella xylanilytica]PPK84253.1 hypothetical protein CLV84_4022 [Neolewinella xylanilytica]
MRVADFIAGARRFTAERDRGGGAEQLRLGVESEMPLRYAMPFPPDVQTALYARGEPTRTRRGQWHELVQHLTDLAYLTPTRFREWHLARENGVPPDPSLLLAVLEGVDELLREDDYAGFHMLPPPPARGFEKRIDWLERYMSTVVYRLSELTSFDGDLVTRSGYRIGESTAYGRCLAFRMRVFFYDYRADRHSERRKVYFDRASLPQLVALTTFLGDAARELRPGVADSTIATDLQRLLVNADELFDYYRRANRIGPDGSRNYYLQYRVAEAPEPTDTETDRRAARLRRRAARWVRRNDDHVDTGVNHFGVRLMQLSLWRAGFYTGRLDGDIGPLTHLGLLALIEQEREYGDLGDRRLDHVLLPVSAAGEWVVNLRLLAKLLERYLPPPLEDVRREEDEIWARIREAGQEDRVDEAFVARQREIGPYYGRLSAHPSRRVYYGLRGLIRGAFRAIGRIVKWIGGVVQEILGAIFDFVKALAKRLQEGIGTFFAGFRVFAHYLLGRPFVSLGATGAGEERSVLMTRFGIDFDVVSVIDEAASREDIERHTDYLRTSREDATYFLGVIGSCIRTIGLLQPPVGWLRLAVLLARVVHQFLADGRAGRRPVA